MEKSLILSWGECDILLCIYGKLRWTMIHRPINNSTKLIPTAGLLNEGLVEGGEREAVDYKKNTYILRYESRIAAGVPLYLKDVDGVVEGTVQIVVLPKNKDALGIYIENSELNCLKRFNTKEGLIAEYIAYVLRAPEGAQVKLGKIDCEIESGTHVANKLTFSEFNTETGTFAEIKNLLQNGAPT